MTFETLINCHGKVMCVDDTTGALTHCAPHEIMPNTAIFRVSAQPWRTLQFVSETGRVVEYGVPDLIPGPALASELIEIVVHPDEPRDGIVGVRAGDKYLRSSPGGQIDMTADRVPGWEKYRRVSGGVLQDIAALCRYHWIMASTRKLIAPQEIRMADHDTLELGDLHVAIHDLPLVEAAYTISETRAQVPLRGVLFRDGWKHDQILLFNPLVVFVVFGDNLDLLAQFRLAVTSLWLFGQYDGDILVIGDQPRDVIESILPEPFQVKLRFHPMRANDRMDMVAARLAIGNIPSLNCYQPVLYADLDVIFDAPIQPFFEAMIFSEKLSAQSERFHRLGETECLRVGGTLFSEDPMNFKECFGFNAGIIGLPGVVRAGWALRIAQRALRYYAAEHGRDGLPGYEQSMLNYSLRRLDMFEPGPVSSRTQITNLADRLDENKPRGFVHFWPAAENRAMEMQNYFDALKRKMVEIDGEQAVDQLAV